MEEQLHELINLQREQNVLLKRYLWRLRFSLLSLLLITTAIAVVLGFVIYQDRSNLSPPTPSTTGFWSTNQSQGILMLTTRNESDAALEPPRYELIKTD
jgi:hypothetical protein